jgi:thiosulfate/3-mercaptopyruvate sulfurtransferase
MSLPLLLDTAELARHLSRPDLLLVDVSRTDCYERHHLPGAVHIPPGNLQCGNRPAVGKIPGLAALSALFSAIGLTPDKHVVCYDDEGGGWAGRLIWTLDAIGHHRYSYLDGGILAWLAEGRPVESGHTRVAPTDYKVTRLDPVPIAEVEDILPRLGQPGFAIWDARSREEYEGTRVVAARGGHIPGAAHLDWLDLMDRNNHLRLKPLPVIRQLLEERGLSPDKDIVTHCQSHHRSGLTYLVAKILGYPSIKGYHGSWGEWGNRDDTPVALGAA